MDAKPLDDDWKRWLSENLARRCSPQELLAILLKQRFSADSILQEMGEHFPGPEELSAGRKPLDGSWQSWLAENRARQCDAEELLGVLLENRFALDSIAEHMGESFPIRSAAYLAALRQAKRSAPDAQAMSRPSLTRLQSASVRKVDSDKLQLYVVDDFMSSAECDAMAALIDRHLRPSTITLAETDKYFRTSRTCDLGLLADPLVHEIDARIAATLGIRLPYSEALQGQRYDVGQQFKAHTDYFEPGTDEYQEHALARGNRTWTFMVYLNDAMAGGGTRFAAIDTVFSPRKGQALAWNNLRPDGTPNYDTLHSGMPVERGHKTIITKWFREKGTGPVFSDEQQAASA